MKKELAEKITKKIKKERKEIRTLDIESFEFRKAYIELQNLLSLKEYPVYLYDAGVLLTDINGYREENGISEDLSDEDVKQEFATKYQALKEKFDSMVYQPITESDLAIHNLMQTKQGYEYLKGAQFNVKSLLDERDNLYANIHLGYNIPIKGLELLTEDSANLSISEILYLKEKIQTILKELPDLQNFILNYSQDHFRAILSDNYENHIERLNAIFTIINLKSNDPAFQTYSQYYFRFKPLYNEYKSLRFKSHFSKKYQERLHEVVNEILDIYQQIVIFLKTILPERDKQIIDIFGTAFKNMSTVERANKIDEYIEELPKVIEVLNTALDDLLRQKKFKNDQITRALLDIKEKSGIIITDGEDFAAKDFFESYEKIDLRNQARNLDTLSTKEIIENYGQVSAEHLYRIIPIK